MAITANTITNPVTIQVAEIKRPAPGKKQGALYDSDGRRWGLWPNDIAKFSIGAHYKINEYTSSMFNGQEYLTISKFEMVGGATTRIPPSGATQSAPAGSFQQPAPQPNLAAEHRSEDIFVCGALNNILSNPSVNPLAISPAQMIGIVNMLRQTWSNTLKRSQSNNNDLNDEIPFS